MKKIVSFIVITMMLLFCRKPVDSQDTVSQPVVIADTLPINYQDIIASECNFILGHQLNDGAFTMSSNKESLGYKIVPYFSNIAARALLEDPTPGHIAAVKNWITWYIKHLNADGSVYDYYASNYKGEAALKPTGDFDSIDSYAATFFTLLRKLCEVSPVDINWLKNTYSTDLKKIGEALILVTESDGLTIAKPTYAVKYTMDNAEVNEGIKDMIWLSQNVVSGRDPVKWQALLTGNTNGIENGLWNNAKGSYFMYKGGPAADWGVFYADATCQLYPVWCGVIAPNSMRAINLWNMFNSKYTDWSTGTIYDAGGFPWAVVSYVAAVMNDKKRTESYLRYVQSFTGKGNEPTANWYNLEAAFVILAASK